MKNKYISNIFKMNIIKNTAILSMALIIVRIIGFLFRIFLVRCIGEEGIGIFQLIFPVQIIGFAICQIGFETALSKLVSSTENDEKCISYLKYSIFLSMIFSILTVFFLYKFSGYISARILFEKRCENLIKIIGFTIPFAAVHACICGYFMGKKNSKLMAVSSLIEQLSRVLFTITFICILNNKNKLFKLEILSLGSIVGEIFAAVFSYYYLKKYYRNKKEIRLLIRKAKNKSIKKSINNNITIKYIKKILSITTPITLNKLMISVLQSIQSILIPTMLIRFGYDNKAALEIYGIMLGIVLPLISFPGAFINSFGTVLLPVISKADSEGYIINLKNKIKNTIIIVFIFGVCINLIMINFGNTISMLLFHDNYGKYIIPLSFLCPFMFDNTVMSSIINGLGKTYITFIANMISSLIQIFFIAKVIPIIGIYGFILGILLGSITMFNIYLIVIRKYYKSYGVT